LDADIHSGISGATARLVVAVDESDLRPKCILWANEAGDSEGAAFRRAQEKINIQLAKLRGEIAGFYSKVIAPPLPKRTYVTLIVAVNEEVPEEISELDSSERRERLAALLRLLGNDTRAINLARIAKIFGVSRDTVYKDLEKLGAKR
jgi:DNA invertase Pin-like site-specific DNA recombinase